MFDTFKKFLTDVYNSEAPEKVIYSRRNLAEAALMYHVIAVDGVITEEERSRMLEVLGSSFDLSEEDSRKLGEDAIVAEHEAIDLYKFTSILKNSLDHEECKRIIENLWEMVFADGVVHELEDNVVWRVAELIGVDTRERMTLKQRVWKRRSSEFDHG